MIILLGNLNAFNISKSIRDNQTSQFFQKTNHIKYQVCISFELLYNLLSTLLFMLYGLYYRNSRLSLNLTCYHIYKCSKTICLVNNILLMFAHQGEQTNKLGKVLFLQLHQQLVKNRGFLLCMFYPNIHHSPSYMLNHDPQEDMLTSQP